MFKLLIVTLLALTVASMAQEIQDEGRLDEAIPSAYGPIEMMEPVEPHSIVRRQVTMVAQPSSIDGPNSSGPFFSFLSDLGPQLEKAKALSTLLSPSPQTGSSSQGSPMASFSSLTDTVKNQQPQSAGELMGQLSSLIRATQERSAKMVDGAQQSVQHAGQQATQSSQQATQSAQGGIQAALTEIGAGLQRLAANNPNLVPDVKNLYSSVSSKLSAASNSVAQAAQPNTPQQQQVADSLSKAIASPSS